MAELRNIKRYRWSLIALFLLMGCLFFYFQGDPEQEKFRTATVETGAIEEVITAQGKLEPRDYVNVGSQVSGQIQKIHVQISDVVKKGQLLAEIDPRIYQSKVEEDTARIVSLKAQLADQLAVLELASRQHSRNQSIYTQQAISKDRLDQSESALKQARAKAASFKAQIEQANSQLQANKTNLDYTKVYAPMDGVVASLPVREGQTLNSVQSAPTLMEIDNLDVMTARAQVAEADISKITLGMPAYFTTLGDMEHRWKGTVRLIQQLPEIINDVVLYNVLIDVENPEHKLMNGMSTQIFFELGKAENVPILALEALGKRMPKEDNEKGKAYQAQVKKDGKIESRIVFVGRTDRMNAEIKDGLTIGERVLIPQKAKPASKSGNSSGRPPGSGPRL